MPGLGSIVKFIGKNAGKVAANVVGIPVAGAAAGETAQIPALDAETMALVGLVAAILNVYRMFVKAPAEEKE
jgi:hypothetical protein